MQHLKKSPPLRRQPRSKVDHDLLSRAHGLEIDWTHAAPLLKEWSLGDVCFVYFIGEENDGAVKVGSASNPIKRLRTLQTGNPRRLKIERLIYGDLETERRLHRYFADYSIGGKRQTTIYKAPHAKTTEWFEPAARPRLIEAADAILAAQRELRADDPWMPGVEEERALYESVIPVMAALGYVYREQDTVQFLAPALGYTEIGLD